MEDRRGRRGKTKTGNYKRQGTKHKGSFNKCVLCVPDRGKVRAKEIMADHLLKLMKNTEV